MKKFINAKDSMFFVCDMQKVFQPLIHKMPAVMASTVLLTKSMKNLEVPVVHSEHYVKAFGKTVDSVQQALDEYHPDRFTLEKRCFTMVTDELKDFLQANSDRKTMIISGIETHVCVLQSCLNFLDMGYKTVVVADAVSSQRKHDSDVALKRMEKEGAIITTAESLIYEMMVTSTHKEFKGILKHVKERSENGNFF